ncbi:LANO_0A07294g1_1 [Lachancea nothofagi CBS 11611]|uniref:LANO_0A07294g1_1 n=1 Tax=Lachancea nothofagi CBS 11611 TaxID=1266666 RepID=A0A1G4ISB9_9SACH|nr:LANO_0A07294g1_1 [Lachancea nothofagi CBS 11611]
MENEADFDSEFVRKYGPVNVEWIDPPPNDRLFVKPHALNYFFNGKLYRTRQERGSAVFELFFDLLYVGIISNLAEAAIEEATGSSFAKYVLLFMAAWQIWTDMREFMDYYYNNDLSQKLYVLWIMVLLVVFANNANEILESKAQTGIVVGCYILARFSAISLTFVYTFFIEEHRQQMRWFSLFTCVSLLIFGFIIIAPLHGKIAIAAVCYFYDSIAYGVTFHPWFKKLIGARYSTAINIEHEVERHGAFVVIALGEYLYSIVASSPAASGFNERTARAISVLVVAYCLSWFYFKGEGSQKAIHALRRSVLSAYSWIYIHVPLMISLIISADAAGALTKSQHLYAFEEQENGVTEEERPNYIHSVQIFYGGGLAIAIMCTCALAFCDKSLDPAGKTKVSSKYRIIPRVLMAGVVFGISFADIKITLYMGLIAVFMATQLLYESISELPSRKGDEIALSD